MKYKNFLVKYRIEYANIKIMKVFFFSLQCLSIANPICMELEISMKKCSKTSNTLLVKIELGTVLMDKFIRA